MTEAGAGPGLHPSQTDAELYKVLADYSALSDRELSMAEGEVVELIKVGCGGWWYVRSVVLSSIPNLIKPVTGWPTIRISKAGPRRLTLRGYPTGLTGPGSGNGKSCLNLQFSDTAKRDMIENKISNNAAQEI